MNVANEREGEEGVEHSCMSVPNDHINEDKDEKEDAEEEGDESLWCMSVAT